jgi:hypothetical protein
MTSESHFRYWGRTAMGRVRERAGASAVRMRPRAARFRDQPPTAVAVARAVQY